MDIKNAQVICFLHMSVHFDNAGPAKRTDPKKKREVIE